MNVLRGVQVDFKLHVTVNGDIYLYYRSGDSASQSQSPRIERSIISQ